MRKLFKHLKFLISSFRLVVSVFTDSICNQKSNKTAHAVNLRKVALRLFTTSVQSRNNPGFFLMLAFLPVLVTF
jgi:hypothetical protein